MTEVKDAPQKRNKFEQVSYLAGITAIVSYLDDTGEEHHAERLVLAEEWTKSFAELCATIQQEDKQRSEDETRSG